MAGEESSASVKVRGGEWPSHVVFSSDYVWNACVRESDLFAKYKVTKRVRLRGACNKVRVTKIEEQTHPACGQFGLCAAAKLTPGEHVIDYVGLVTLSGNEDKTSDYTVEFGELSELCVDSNRIGNEARFCNDFRNTGRKPNVEFRLYVDEAGDARLGIFVLGSLKKPLPKGTELLISYGKGYWTARLGSLDFVEKHPEH
ncbi:hypothetical protein FVE85_8423 [Porphyridium purpureum]|uniref:SET domain-containing protein n=1 Tax=Porphyridium purpureum TaxID=35688 RepID=A0A5J4YKF1_PORPP|nr:hypothetical protein FVE85_8423 [Porphyridium purpureum]|eukprot:POR7152..scf244_11